VAGKDITNRGSKLSSNGETSLKAGHDIIFSAVAQKKQVQAGSQSSSYQSEQVASLNAQGDTILVAGHDAQISAGSLSVGKDLALVAENDVALNSAQNSTHYRSGSRLETGKVSYSTSRVQADGAMRIVSGHDLSAQGSNLTAGKSLSLVSGNDLTLKSNQNSTLYNSNNKHKKDKVSRTQHQGTSLYAGRGLDIEVAGNTTLESAKFAAKGDISVQSGGAVIAKTATDTDDERHYLRRHGFWGTSYTDTKTHTTHSVSNMFDSGGKLAIVSDGHQIHQASRIEARGDVTLQSTQGALVMLSATDTDYLRHDKKHKGLVVKSAGNGHAATTKKISEIHSDGSISMAGALGMQADYVSQDGNLARALSKLPAGQNYAWMTALKNNPNVDWHQVSQMYDSWSYQHKALNGPAAAMIAIAVAAATAGSGLAAAAGSSFSSAVGGGSIVTSMGSAATVSLASQVSVALVKNQGDFGATLREMENSPNMHALATSIVTAGVMGEAGIAAKSGLGTSLARQAVDRTVRTAVQSGVSSTVNGESFSRTLNHGLRTAGAEWLGAHAANTIGDLGLGQVISGVRMEDASVGKALLHGLTQGGAARLAGHSFAAGAAGGLASELTSKMIGKSHLRNGGEDNRDAQTALEGVVGAIAGGLATGNNDGAYAGKAAGESVYRNNYLNHQEVGRLKKLKAACSRSKNKNSAACGEVEHLEYIDDLRNKQLHYSCRQDGSGGGCQSKTASAEQAYHSFADYHIQSGYDDSPEVEHAYAALQEVQDPTGLRREEASRNVEIITDVATSSLMAFDALKALKLLKLGKVAEETSAVIKAGEAGTGREVASGSAAEDTTAGSTVAEGAEGTTGASDSSLGATDTDSPVKIVQLHRGTKGNWNKIAHKPEPNTEYEFDNGYSYKTDSKGRVDTVEADLKFEPWDRNSYQQSVSGRECRDVGDCGGHLIASMFGGPGEGVNLVPMDAKLNGAGGEWYKLETQWRDVLDNGGSVKVKIEPKYSESSKRPDSFDVEYSINGGKQITRDLKNTPTGE
jgi:hypothetical protein